MKNEAMKKLMKSFVLSVLYIEDFVYRCLDLISEKILTYLDENERE